jgi:hypothetical protein
MKSFFLCVVSLSLAAVPLFAEVPGKKEEATPRKIVEKFHQALAEKDRDAALEHVAELKFKKEFAEELDKFLKSDEPRGKLSVFDEKVIGDLAVVIEGTEGKDYRTGVDLDPVFLQQVDGQWRIVRGPAAALGAELIMEVAKDKKQAEKNLMELGRWYGARKAEIYSQREKAAKNR